MRKFRIYSKIDTLPIIIILCVHFLIPTSCWLIRLRKCLFALVAINAARMLWCLVGNSILNKYFNHNVLLTTQHHLRWLFFFLIFSYELVFLGCRLFFYTCCTTNREHDKKRIVEEKPYADHIACLRKLKNGYKMPRYIFIVFFRLRCCCWNLSNLRYLNKSFEPMDFCQPVLETLTALLIFLMCWVWVQSAI